MTLRRRRSQSGVTLMEMIMVVALIGLVIAITFPAVGSGLGTVRLNAATGSIVTFLNQGLNRANRQQKLTEVVVDLDQNQLQMFTTDPGFSRSLAMPEGVRLQRVYPELPGVDERKRSLVLYPGGVVPAMGIEVTNERGQRRIVRVDPTTGVPMVTTP